LFYGEHADKRVVNDTTIAACDMTECERDGEAVVLLDAWFPTHDARDDKFSLQGDYTGVAVDLLISYSERTMLVEVASSALCAKVESETRIPTRKVCGQSRPCYTDPIWIVPYCSELRGDNARGRKPATVIQRVEMRIPIGIARKINEYVCKSCTVHSLGTVMPHVSLLFNSVRFEWIERKKRRESKRLFQARAELAGGRYVVSTVYDTYVVDRAIYNSRSPARLLMYMSPRPDTSILTVCANVVSDSIGAGVTNATLENVDNMPNCEIKITLAPIDDDAGGDAAGGSDTDTVTDGSGSEDVDSDALRNNDDSDTPDGAGAAAIPCAVSGDSAASSDSAVSDGAKRIDTASSDSASSDAERGRPIARKSPGESRKYFLMGFRVILEYEEIQKFYRYISGIPIDTFRN
jgi:hypothetical protein